MLGDYVPKLASLQEQGLDRFLKLVCCFQLPFKRCAQNASQPEMQNYWKLNVNISSYEYLLLDKATPVTSSQRALKLAPTAAHQARERETRTGRERKRDGEKSDAERIS